MKEAYPKLEFGARVSLTHSGWWGQDAYSYVYALYGHTHGKDYGKGDLFLWYDYHFVRVEEGSIPLAGEPLEVHVISGEDLVAGKNPLFNKIELLTNTK